MLAACGSGGGDSKAEPLARSTARTVGVCPDFVLCIKGDHWDTNLCRCVPDDDAGAATDAADETADDASTAPGDGGDEGNASSCPNH